MTATWTPEKQKQYAREWHQKNKDRSRKQNIMWLKANPQKRLEVSRKSYRRRWVVQSLGKARLFAKRRKLPFSLKETDIFFPDVCPVLGIPLEIGEGHVTANSPTLFRIVDQLGYVKCNVRIISRSASMRQNTAGELWDRNA